MSEIHFLGSKFPKNIVCNFKNNSTAAEVSDIDEQELVQVGMLVTADSPAVGHTAIELGLAYHLELMLTHINRDGVTLPVQNIQNLIINVYDELYFTGDMTQVDALSAQLQLTVMTDEYGHQNDEDGEGWMQRSASLNPLLSSPTQIYRARCVCTVFAGIELFSQSIN